MRSSRWRVVGVLLAACVLLAAACGGDDKKDEQGAAQATATAPRQPDPVVLAKQAADKVEALKSFHFLLEHENGGTPIVLNLDMTRAEGDIVKPDRLQADVDAKATQLGGANIKAKVNSVGDKTQITNPFNPRQWVPLPGSATLADIFDPSAGTTAALRSATNLRITGEDVINGVKVWKLEGDIDAGALQNFTRTAEAGYPVKGTAWVGRDTPHVYRIRMEGPIGSKDAKNIVRKVELSKFDEPITIEAP